jgi:hypothetical protein
VLLKLELGQDVEDMYRHPMGRYSRYKMAYMCIWHKKWYDFM